MRSALCVLRSQIWDDYIVHTLVSTLRGAGDAGPPRDGANQQVSTLVRTRWTRGKPRQAHAHRAGVFSPTGSGCLSRNGVHWARASCTLTITIIMYVMELGRGT
jgi:hypothetical protein